MTSYAKAVDLMKRFSSDSYSSDNSLHLIPLNIKIKWLLGRPLSLVEVVLGYSFGMYIGAAIGWLLGWYTGDVYVEHFKPVYFSDFAELDEIVTWCSQTPYEFARNGKLIGVVVGAIAIAIINSKLLSQRVTSLYKKEVTEPKKIAQAFGKSERQIERKIKKLVKKGKIN